MPNNEQAWSDPEKENLREWWLAGVGPTEIGRRLKRSVNSVTSMRDRMGLPPRGSPIGRTSKAPPSRRMTHSTRLNVRNPGLSTLLPLASLMDD